MLAHRLRSTSLQSSLLSGASSMLRPTWAYGTGRVKSGCRRLSPLAPLDDFVWFSASELCAPTSDRQAGVDLSRSRFSHRSAYQRRGSRPDRYLVTADECKVALFRFRRIQVIKTWRDGRPERASSDADVGLRSCRLLGVRTDPGGLSGGQQHEARIQDEITAPQAPRVLGQPVEPLESAALYPAG
jgi:hypothetical protein